MITGKMLDRRQFIRYRCKGILPGVMYLDGNRGVKVVCTPLDVSRIGLAIMTQQEIPKGETLFFETNSETVPLKIMFTCQNPHNPDEFRYGLMSERNDFDLETVFRKAGCIEINSNYRTLNLSKKATENLKVEEMFAPALRATRFKPDQLLRVDAKTFGSRDFYQLAIEDLSLSGIHLSVQNQEKVPFVLNTILELVIDPKKSLLEEPIAVSVKVVHRFDREGHVNLKTNLIDVDPKELPRWEALLSATSYLAGQSLIFHQAKYLNIRQSPHLAC